MTTETDATLASSGAEAEAALKEIESFAFSKGYRIVGIFDPRGGFIGSLPSGNLGVEIPKPSWGIVSIEKSADPT